MDVDYIYALPGAGNRASRARAGRVVITKEAGKAGDVLAWEVHKSEEGPSSCYIYRSFEQEKCRIYP